MPPYEIPTKIVYEQGGGMNLGAPPNEIESNECVNLVNFYPFGKKNIRRGGSSKVMTVAFPETLVSFLPYKPFASTEYHQGPRRREHSDPGHYLVMFGKSKVGIVADSARRTDDPAPITIISSSAFIPTLNNPWVAFQYSNNVYACRKGDGKVYMIGTTKMVQAGLAAPTIPHTKAQGAAGALAAGNYQAVYTYFDSVTGAESNPSKPTAILALASLKKIVHTLPAGNAPFGNMGRTTHRSIYRTLLNQVGEYYYVGQVATGVTTEWLPAQTLTEETLPADMGDPVLFDNNVPRIDITWAAMWNDRMFATDGTDLFFSNLFNPEGWTNDVYPVYREDGNEIRVLFNAGDRLIIGKTNKVHYLVGTDRSTFRLLTLSDKHGVMSGHSMRVAEGNLFWYGSGNNFYRSDGTSTQAIGDIKIRRILDNIPDDLQDQVTAEVIPALSQYIASIPSTGYVGAYNRVVVVYNYRSDTWTTYTHPGYAPQYLGEYFDSGYKRFVYGTLYDSRLHRLYDSADLDDEGIAIQAELLTREEDGGSLMSKAIRRVHILSSPAPGAVVSAYRDGRGVPSAYRTVDLSDSDQAWKVANLSTLKDPGSTVQVGLVYTGTTPLEIEAIGLEIEEIERFNGQPQ